jgi:hypothetical protein
MSDRRHTAELLAKRLIDCDARQQQIHHERRRIYAAAAAADISRADIKHLALMLSKSSRKKVAADG